MTSEQSKERAWVARSIETWTRRHRRRKSFHVEGISRSSAYIRHDDDRCAEIVVRAVADTMAENATWRTWPDFRNTVVAKAIEKIRSGLGPAGFEQGLSLYLTKCQDKKA